MSLRSRPAPSPCSPAATPGPIRREAAPLLPRIAECGAIVSEMPLAWEPRGRDFPRRNRIVSGLALGVDHRRGGARLRLADHGPPRRRAGARGARRPGSPLDPRAEGTNDLLRDGATLCARVEDALNALEPLRARASVGRMEEPRPGDDLRLDELADASEPASAERDDFGEPAVGARVAALLGPAPVSIDELARVANANVRLVRAALVELELAGRIEHSGGDRVAQLTGRDQD